jgi:hypothetical protein
MEWATVPREEQETVINIDYDEKILNFYTTRKSTARRLEKKIGKADSVETIDGEICAVSYKRKLTDKSINAFFSKTIMCGGFAHQNTSDDNLY